MTELYLVEYFDHWQNNNSYPLSSQLIKEKLKTPITLFAFGEKLHEDENYLVLYDLNVKKNEFIIKSAIKNIKIYTERG